jgi:predicted nucleic acid-binding Zn ribbon protein
MDLRRKHQALREWTRVPTPLPARAARTKGTSLAELLPGVVAQMGLEQRVQQQMILEVWPKVVGPAIAKHAQPTQLHRGVLTISVANSVWLYELSRNHKETILEKLTQRLNPSPIKEIQFRAG